MAIDDVTDACGILRPVYDGSGGADGFVSLEVVAGPGQRHRRDDRRGPRPPPADQPPQPDGQDPGHRRRASRPSSSMIAEGRNINVTLIFSLERYGEVIEAYLSGLERCARRAATCRECTAWRRSSSAGSTPRSTGALGARRRGRRPGRQGGGGPGPAGLPAVRAAVLRAPVGGSGRRKAPIRSGRCGRRRRPRTRPTRTCSTWTADRAAHRQHHARRHSRRLPRPRHGGPNRRLRLRRGPEPSWTHWRDAGVDMADVARVLEDEGVASFTKSYDELLQALHDKANSGSAPAGEPGPVERPVPRPAAAGQPAGRGAPHGPAGPTRRAGGVRSVGRPDLAEAPSGPGEPGPPATAPGRVRRRRRGPHRPRRSGVPRADGGRRAGRERGLGGGHQAQPLRRGRLRRPGHLRAASTRPRRAGPELDLPGNRTYYLATVPAMFDEVAAGLGAGRPQPTAAAGCGRPAGDREAVRPGPPERPSARRRPAPDLRRARRSTGSTTTWARRRCRTSWPCASPTPSSSRSGTAATSTTCRSRWPNRSASRSGAASTSGPAPCATSSRTTSCRCCRSP